MAEFKDERVVSFSLASLVVILMVQLLFIQYISMLPTMVVMTVTSYLELDFGTSTKNLV